MHYTGSRPAPMVSSRSGRRPLLPVALVATLGLAAGCGNSIDTAAEVLASATTSPSARAPRSPAPEVSATALTFTPCVGLHIGKNSQFQSSFDPTSRVLTVDYYIDYPNGGEGHAVIDGADPSCLANPTVRPLLDDARAAADASMRSSCTSAREFLSCTVRARIPGRRA